MTDTRYPRVADLLSAVERLREENRRLRAALAPVLAVHERFKHLDELLSDEHWLTAPGEFQLQYHVLYDLWQAVKAAARAGGKGGSMSDEDFAELRQERDRLVEAARSLVATEYYTTGIWAMVYLDRLEALAALIEPPVIERPHSPQVTAARAAAALVPADDAVDG